MRSMSVTTFPNYPGGKIYPGYKNRPRTVEQLEPGITITRTAVLPSHDTSAFKRVLTYLSFATTAALLGLPRDEKFDVIYAYQGQATIGIPALVGKTALPRTGASARTGLLAGYRHQVRSACPRSRSATSTPRCDGCAVRCTPGWIAPSGCRPA